MKNNLFALALKKHSIRSYKNTRIDNYIINDII